MDGSRPRGGDRVGARLLAFGVGISVILTTGAAAHAAGSWATTTTPNPGPSYRSLSGVTAVSSTDVWAVGSYASASNSDAPLAIRWTGAGWVRSALPAPSGGTGGLTAVSAATASNVWAAGWQGSTTAPWILHYTGSAWSAVSTAGLPADLQISSMAAASASDVWVSGHVGLAPFHAAVAHWNGTTWTSWTFSPPNCSIFNGITLVPGTNQVIAAGQVGVCGRGTEAAYVRRWNGTRWLQPAMPTADGQAFTVLALSARDVWLAGTQTTDNWNTSSLLFEHWDGTTWSLVASPALSGSDGSVYSLAAQSSNDLLAVGWQYPACTGGTCPNQRTLAAQWNGSSWAIVPTPNPATSPTDGVDQFAAAVAEPGTGAYWAVGHYGRSGVFSKTLAARYS